VLIAPARAASFEEVIYPRALGSFLRGIGYRLDVDTRAGREGNKDDLLADLDLTLRKRFEAAFSLLHREPWDYFQLHVSETDGSTTSSGRTTSATPRGTAAPSWRFTGGSTR
jgi:hypothetical protein